MGFFLVKTRIQNFGIVVSHFRFSDSPILYIRLFSSVINCCRHHPRAFSYWFPWPLICVKRFSERFGIHNGDFCVYLGNSGTTHQTYGWWFYISISQFIYSKAYYLNVSGDILPINCSFINNIVKSIISHWNTLGCHNVLHENWKIISYFWNCSIESKQLDGTSRSDMLSHCLLSIPHPNGKMLSGNFHLFIMFSSDLYIIF